MMKLVSVTVFSAFLAVAYSMNTDMTEASRRKTPFGAFDMENALLYVTKHQKFLVGAALLTAKYALSLACFFKEYIENGLSTSSLSVGTDVPFSEYRDFKHYLVEKVVGDRCGRNHSLAIITIKKKRNQDELPFVRMIALTSVNYPDLPENTYRTQATMIGWDRTKSETNFYNKYTNFIIRVENGIIYHTLYGHKVNNDFFGGFFIYKDALAGVAFTRDDAYLQFVKVYGDNKFIQKATGSTVYVSKNTEI